MKIKLLLLILLFSAALQAQKFSISVEQAAGISSLTGEVLPFDPLFSYQTTLSAELSISPSISLGSGAGIQHTGASSEIALTNTSGNPIGVVRNFELFDYIKIPIEIRYTGNSKYRYIAGLGGFYNILRKHTTTNNNENVIPIAVLAEYYLPANHVGLRLRQGVGRQFSEKFSMEVSVLAEYGIKKDPQPVSLWNTYFTVAFSYKP